MSSNCKTIHLYGNASSCEKARLLLENLPQIKRADPVAASVLRLYITAPLHEKSLIPLLAQSGISGFRLI